MSQTKSVSRNPRFIILICTVIALWVAMPFVFDLASHADGGHGSLPALVAQLSGDPIADVTPRGVASYSVAASGTPEPARQLYVNVSNMNLPTGTEVEVALNGSPIGTITLSSNWPSGGTTRGALLLSTSHGDTVPTVVDGDTVTVGTAPAGGAVTYLSGTFAVPTPFPSPTGTHTPWPSPSHTPFPTPSHTPFPTPSGTPFPSPSPRAFAARMNGANEVPPVTTDGAGFGFAALNSAETQIRVCIGYRNLSSGVTAITINGPASTTENGPVIFTLTLPTNSFGFSSQTFDVSPEQVAELRAGLWYFQVVTVDNVDGEIRGQLNPINPRCCGHTHGGGNGGGGMLASDDADETTIEARSTYIPAPFDFDGDGITDIAVFRAGAWNVTQSSDGRTVAWFE